MDTDTLVVGAGPAGLAVAAALTAKGRRPLVIEKAGQVGASWRDHYERLHLHTVKELSTLPGLAFPDSAPRYVPRQGDNSVGGRIKDYQIYVGNNLVGK